MGARKLGLILLVVGCIATLGSSALSAESPEALEMVLFAHADASVGEANVHRAIRGNFMVMDGSQPDEDVPKSIGLTNLGIAPSRRCVGSPYFPVWTGAIGGHIRGDVVFEFYVVSSPGGEVDVRIWPDVDVTECADHYHEPAARTSVRLPVGSGKVLARMENVDVEAANNIIIQISPKALSPTQGRVLFDARTAPTSLRFECTPLWGDRCEPYED